MTKHAKTSTSIISRWIYSFDSGNSSNPNLITWFACSSNSACFYLDSCLPLLLLLLFGHILVDIVPCHILFTPFCFPLSFSINSFFSLRFAIGFLYCRRCCCCLCWCLLPKMSQHWCCIGAHHCTTRKICSCHNVSFDLINVLMSVCCCLCFCARVPV